MTLFDRWLVVDWSAAGRPVTGANSIWIADADHDRPLELSNPSTRAEAARLIRDAVIEEADRRLLVAIDVSLGYPRGTAARFGLEGTPWRAMWSELARLIDDDPANRNNRFDVAAALNAQSAGPGPFWGCPPRHAGPELTATRPDRTEGERFRRTELRLHDAGWHPKSAWQLAYSGSVGSQSLTAIPVLERLCREFGDRVVVWPFAGAQPPATGPGSVVVAEVYPSMFSVEVPAAWVLDAAQVAGVATALGDVDARGELAAWFAPELTDAERRVVETEEGWVLGPADLRPAR